MLEPAASGAAASGADTPRSEVAANDWAPDVRGAKRYARRRQGEVSFAVVGLNDRIHRFHAARTVPAASVFKAMLLAAYLRQRSVADRRLRDRERRLLRPMIRRSNDVAATRVRDIVGRRAIERLARRAGMRRFAYHEVWGLSLISAAGQARFFDRYEEYVPARHERFARRQLAGIVRSQRWGVGKVAPDGWELFFKGGWGSGSGAVDHQVAWLERGEHRVALAILTTDSPSHRYAKRTLEGVARRLLDDLPKPPSEPATGRR